MSDAVSLDMIFKRTLSSKLVRRVERYFPTAVVQVVMIDAFHKALDLTQERLVLRLSELAQSFERVESR
jgi:branched-subunit amino acid transport protein AzlD